MENRFETFGKYVLLERLAAGGMAEVFLAKSRGAGGIGKFVAIKRILPQYSDNPEFIDMFKEEAKVAMNLNHGNIVSIFDFGIERNQFYLVMEYVEGQNLRQVLNHMKKVNKEFSVDQAVYMIKEVAAGLDHAHRCLDSSTGRPLNITHRDMSPQNIMVSFEGEVKVVDFGIAKAETQLEHTRAGTIKGKFGYMSPEQAEGQQVDLRTDIFAIGIVLWELLAKDRLFTAQSEAATLRRIRDCNIPSLRKINPAIPVDLERICIKALTKDKTLRYQTAAAFHKDLNRFLNTQYPDFSPQEFSIFMKSLYSDMYLENRKKLSEYAKMDAPAGSHDQDKTSVTQTMTSTATGTGATNSEEKNHNLAGVNFAESKKIDVSSLKLDPLKSAMPKVPPQQQVPSHTLSGITPAGTRSSIRAPQPHPASSNPWFSTALVMLLVAGGGWFFWKNNGLKKQKPKEEVEVAAPLSTSPPQGQVDAASKQIVVLNVQSEPQGAVIYIDNQRVGITPYRGHIDINKPFQLRLTRDGFIDYEVPSAHATAEGYSLMATLMPEPISGTVSIDIPNGGASPVITVNGRRLSEKLPIQKLKVPAGIPLEIQAVNPYTHLQAKTIITLGQSEHRNVRLILGRAAQGR